MTEKFLLKVNKSEILTNRACCRKTQINIAEMQQIIENDLTNS